MFEMIIAKVTTIHMSFFPLCVSAFSVTKSDFLFYAALIFNDESEF